MSKTAIEVGDKVYIASELWTKVYKPCPVCYGKLEVTLILGNGDHAVVDCQYCRQGFEGPTGRDISHYEHTPHVDVGIVYGIRIEQTPKGTVTSYEFGNETARRVRRSEDVFLANLPAQERAEQKAKEANEREEKKIEEPAKEKRGKSHSWHVGYYKRQIKNAQRDLMRYRKAVRYHKSRIPKESEE